MLPKNAVIEFQDIYQKELGITLSLEQALQKAEDFMRLFEIITKRPMDVEKKEEYDQT